MPEHVERSGPILLSRGLDNNSLYLCEVAHRFQGCLRASDVLGRVGGDEFIVVIADMLDPGLAAEVADRLLQTMHTPFVAEGITIEGSVSIGVAIFQDFGGTASELKYQADAAMYAAKRAGGGQVSFFESLPLTYKIEIAFVAKPEVADMFRRYGQAYRERHSASMSTVQRRVVTAIEVCRINQIHEYKTYCSLSTRHLSVLIQR